MKVNELVHSENTNNIDLRISEIQQKRKRLLMQFGDRIKNSRPWLTLGDELRNLEVLKRSVENPI
jgi:hypothetical protein